MGEGGQGDGRTSGLSASPLRDAGHGPERCDNPRVLAPVLPGRWRLVSYLATDVDSGVTVHPMGEGARGVLEYSADGKVSVHILGAGGADYLGYYGDFIVDEANATVTHAVELSSEPGLVGARNLRHATLDAAAAMLVLSGPMTIAGRPHAIRVTWRRESRGENPGR